MGRTLSGYCKLFVPVSMLVWAGIGLMLMLCWAVLGGGVPAHFEVDMAIPRGRKEDKNGRRQYSQSARAVKYRQEMGVGEFAEDNAAAVETTQPPALENPQELPIPPGEFSTEAIGVTTTATIAAPVEPAAPEEEDVYFCDNCKHRPITPSDSQCPTCEETLNWSGLT
jgi:hypothetical protein